MNERTRRRLKKDLRLFVNMMLSNNPITKQDLAKLLREAAAKLAPGPFDKKSITLSMTHPNPESLMEAEAALGKILEEDRAQQKQQQPPQGETQPDTVMTLPKPWPAANMREYLQRQRLSQEKKPRKRGKKTKDAK